MAKIAGTESTAKIRSTNSISTSARNSGVAHQTSGAPGASTADRRFASGAGSLHPEAVAVRRVGDAQVRAQPAQQRIAGDVEVVLWRTSASSRRWRAGRRRTGRAPRRTALTSAAPSPIMIARSTITPSMPQNSTRCWYCERHGEEREDHRDDEHVVHRQRLLDQEAGEVLHAALRAEVPPDPGAEGEPGADVAGGQPAGSRAPRSRDRRGAARRGRRPAARRPRPMKPSHSQAGLPRKSAASRHHQAVHARQPRAALYPQ